MTAVENINKLAKYLKINPGKITVDENNVRIISISITSTRDNNNLHASASSSSFLFTKHVYSLDSAISFRYAPPNPAPYPATHPFCTVSPGSCPTSSHQQSPSIRRRRRSCSASGSTTVHSLALRSPRIKRAPRPFFRCGRRTTILPDVPID